MKIKPILFSTPMVQAILNGSKTQTRRTQGLEKFNTNPDWFIYECKSSHKQSNGSYTHYMEHCDVRGNPLGKYSTVESKIKTGDILWVRETFAEYSKEITDATYVYKADVDKNMQEVFEVYKHNKLVSNWKPSIFMPKKACRIFLEVADIRLERLQNISEEDARDEGASQGIKIDDFVKLVNASSKLTKQSALNPMSTYKLGFMKIWADIYGLDNWQSNPWVWVYTSKKCDKPQNFLQ